MAREAELPDGTILEFPDDTSDEVMDRVVRAQLQPQPVAAAPQPRGMGAELARQAGLATRYGVEGAADALGIFSDPIGEAINAVLPGRPVGRLGDAARQATNAAGLPQPEGGLERVVGGASRAVAGAGPFLAAGGVAAQAPGMLGRFGQQLATAPTGQAIASASGGASAEAAKESGIGPLGQVAAGLAGALAPSGLAGLVRVAARGGDAGRKSMLATIEAFRQSGAGSPTVGQATEGRFARGTEALLGRAPGGAGVIARTGEAQQAGMGQRVQRIADSLSTRSSPEQAGRAIENGVMGPGGFMARFRKTANGLYNRVDQFIPPDSPIPVTNAKATLDKLASPTPGAVETSRVLASGKVADLRGALDADLQASLAAAGRGELPYAAVKALRTRLGDIIADSAFATDVPTKQLKQVYGALTDDLTAAAVATGNPQALEAVKRANSFYRAGMNRMEVLERVVERNGGPEKVFAAAMSGTREGGTTIRAVMQSLPEDGQKQLASAVIRRMGRARPGSQDELGDVFSSETFLTGWDSLSKEAKSTLFGRFGPGYVRDMEQIAKATANLREGAKVFSNPSGTAQGTVQATTAGALMLGILSGNAPAVAAIGGGVAGSNGAARVMTSPRFVKFLARQTLAPVAAIPVQLAKFKAEAIAAGDQDALDAVAAVEAGLAE